MMMLFRSGTYVCPNPHSPVSLSLSNNTQTQQLTFALSARSFREKIRLVFRATRTHACNLAKFATIYKTTCLLLKNYGPTPGKEGKPTLPLSAPATTNKRRRRTRRRSTYQV